MIVWPTKKAPARSFVPASSKRGRQIAAANPAQATIGRVVVTPQDTAKAQWEKRRAAKANTRILAIDELANFK